MSSSSMKKYIHLDSLTCLFSACFCKNHTEWFRFVMSPVTNKVFISFFFAYYFFASSIIQHSQYLHRLNIIFLQRRNLCFSMPTSPNVIISLLFLIHHEENYFYNDLCFWSKFALWSKFMALLLLTLLIIQQ